MTTTEHLQRIKSECERLLANSRDNGIDKYTDRAEAGWRSTIAAIDSISSPQGLDRVLTNQILSAWPIELLTQ